MCEKPEREHGSRSPLSTYLHANFNDNAKHMNKDVFHLLVTFSALLSFEDHYFLLNKICEHHFFFKCPPRSMLQVFESVQSLLEKQLRSHLQHCWVVSAASFCLRMVAM